MPGSRKKVHVEMLVLKTSDSACRKLIIVELRIVVQRGL
jgi:hypothetical protein